MEVGAEKKRKRKDPLMGNGDSQRDTNRSMTTGKPSLVDTSRQVSFNEGIKNEVAMIAATFANTQLQMSNASSAYYENMTAQLAKAKEQLETQAVEQQQDVRLMMKALEERLDGARKENAKMRSEVDAAHELARQNVNDEISAMQNALRQRDILISRLQSRLEELKEELKSVEVFRLERDERSREMEELQMTYEDEQISHHYDKQDLRLRMREERVRLAAEQRVMNERRAEDVQKMALRFLDEKTRETYEKNKELMQEKMLLSTEASAAVEKAEALRRSNAKLLANASLGASAEAEYLARGVRQKREIALLRGQIKDMEANLSATVEQYNERLRKQTKEHVAQVQQLTKERDEARSTSERLHRELVKLRALSQQMVTRRSELELFFYEALMHVRRKLLEERRARPYPIRCLQGGAMGRLPTPRLRRESELLLISDRDMQPPAPAKSSGGDDDVTWVKSNGTLEDTNVNSPPFPLIAVRKECPTFAQNRLLPAKKWQCPGGSGALTTRAPCSTEEVIMGNAHFSRIPNAPQLEDLHSVEISQLSWGEKERVLQLLFKRLQGGSNVAKPKQCTPTDDTTFLEEGAVVNPETNTFLTETE